MLDATVGGINANSYVTLAEASAYFSDRAHAAAWEAELNQESILITATSVIDWYITWKGTRADSIQALDWPRSGVYNKLGVLYDTTVIPKDVKTAVFEYALSSLGKDRTSDDALAGIAEVRAGSLMLKTDDGLYDSTPKIIPDKIWKILRGLYSRSGIGVVRLIRA